MNDKDIFRGLDGKQEARNRSEAAGRQGNGPARNDESPPAGEDERPGQEEQAQPCEQLIDEAIEETFPASDPPFWMPSGR